MTEDFEIELSGNKSYKDKELNITANKKILDDIMDYSKGDMDHERGGFLLGSMEETETSYNIFITDIITAKYTVNNTASLTFTYESWNEAYREIEENYKGKKMLGWFHSHPGYGVFLSGMDMFIENNFFNLPYQVAYVADPHTEEIGLFCWESPGKIRKTENILYLIHND